MKTFDEKFLLQEAGINHITARLVSLLEEDKLEAELIGKTRQQVESVLQSWRENLPAGTECKVHAHKRLGRCTIRLYAAGSSINPIRRPEGELVSVGFEFYRVLHNVEPVGKYSYTNGINEFELRLPLRMPKDMTSRIVLAIILALITGFTLQALLPQVMLTYMSRELVNPAVKTMLGLLNGAAGMMIFFSMVAAVCNMGDISTLSNVGSTTLKQYMSRVFICSLLSLPLGLAAFGVLQEGTAMDWSIFGEIYKLVLGMIPTNMVAPFVKGNTMQMMVIALLCGYVMLQLGKKVGTAYAFVNEISVISMDMVRFVCKLLPAIVFLSIVNLQLKGDVSSLLQVWKLLAFYYLLTALCLLAHFVYVSRQTGIGVRQLAADIMPIFMLAAATMTSTPCLPLMDKVCQEKYGISDNIRNFAIPFSSILYMCYHVIGIVGYVCCMAQIYDITISLSTAIIIFICCNIMAYTIPPIPMGLMTILALFFNLASIPAEGLAIAMSVDFIFAGPRMGAKVASSTADIILIDRLLGEEK